MYSKLLLPRPFRSTDCRENIYHSEFAHARILPYNRCVKISNSMFEIYMESIITFIACLSLLASTVTEFDGTFLIQQILIALFMPHLLHVVPHYFHIYSSDNGAPSSNRKVIQVSSAHTTAI